jgi:hypothetical protein
MGIVLAEPSWWCGGAGTASNVIDAGSIPAVAFFFFFPS